MFSPLHCTGNSIAAAEKQILQKKSGEKSYLYRIMVRPAWPLKIEFEPKKEKKKIKGQVGKRGRERSDPRGRDLSARDSIHSTTLRSVCTANRLVRLEMSRTPSCTAHYFYLMGQIVRTLMVRAKPARCIGNLYYSRRFFCRQALRMRTREHPADIDRQTTPS